MDAIDLVLPLFVLLSGLSCVGTLLGLPGNWLILFSAVLLEIFGVDLFGPEFRPLGWGWIIGAGVLAAIGEAGELLASVGGARLGGGGRAGAWGALFGGLIGGLLGTFLLPIPLLGTLIGALAGTFLGALLAEARKKGWREALSPAFAATLARLLGLAFKTAVGMALAVGLTGALILARL
jgi:uncharacterized protein YqgC (DUF456 family)